MAAAATAKPLPFLTITTSRSSLRHLPTSLPTPISSPRRRPPRSYGRGHSSRRRNPQGSAPPTPTPPRAAASHSASALVGGVSDPELRLVLELATDEELMEFEEIIYGTRGWRPSYRNALLGVRRKLGVQCSNKLCTADLEAEIFLHLVDEYSSDQKGLVSFPWDKQKSTKENSSLGVNNWKVLTDAAWRIGAKGLESTFLKCIDRENDL